MQETEQQTVSKPLSVWDALPKIKCPPINSVDGLIVSTLYIGASFVEAVSEMGSHGYWGVGLFVAPLIGLPVMMGTQRQIEARLPDKYFKLEFSASGKTVRIPKEKIEPIDQGKRLTITGLTAGIFVTGAFQVLSSFAIAPSAQGIKSAFTACLITLALGMALGHHRKTLKQSLTNLPAPPHP